MRIDGSKNIIKHLLDHAWNSVAAQATYREWDLCGLCRHAWVDHSCRCLNVQHCQKDDCRCPGFILEDRALA